MKAQNRFVKLSDISSLQEALDAEVYAIGATVLVQLHCKTAVATVVDYVLNFDGQNFSVEYGVVGINLYEYVSAEDIMPIEIHMEAA